MNSAVGFLIVVLMLAMLGFNIWLFIVGVQFLRTGTMAFKRYVADSDRHRVEHTPMQPSQPLSSDQSWPVHRSPGTGA